MLKFYTEDSSLLRYDNLYTGMYGNVSEEVAISTLRVVVNVYSSWNMLKMEAASSTGILCLCTLVHGIIRQNTGTVISMAERTACLADFAFLMTYP
jgi:hypothetical protein